MHALREEECSQVRNMISVGGMLSQVRHALREETHCQEACSLGETLSERDVVSVKRRALLKEAAHSTRKGMLLWEKACSQWGALSLGKACSLEGGMLLGGGMLELQFIWGSSPSLHLLMYTGSRRWKSYTHHSLFHVCIYIHPRFG